MSEKNYYVIDNLNCKVESMTKEQILEAIEQAISTGEIQDVDTGFITKVKELNKEQALQFWVGTQAEYNAISEPSTNVLYIITDDNSKEEIYSAIDTLSSNVVFSNQVCGEIKGVSYLNAISVSGAYNPTSSTQSKTFDFGKLVIMPDNTAYLHVDCIADASDLNRFFVDFYNLGANPAHPICAVLTAIYQDSSTSQTAHTPVTMYIDTGAHSTPVKYNIEIPEILGLSGQNDIQITGIITYLIQGQV